MHRLWFDLLLFRHDILCLVMGKEVLHEKEVKEPILRTLIYNNFIFAVND